MKRAAIGIRAHSGWGALVAISAGSGGIALLERRRIAITEPGTAGVNQPYHFAKGQNLQQAEKYLVNCATAAERLALEALDGVITKLRQHDYATVGCAILQAAGRALPPLMQILASHALIHTAEGEFFRQAFWKASERLEIPVTGIRERDLPERARALLGGRTLQFQRKIAALGKSQGPPWTTDQKSASLAAFLLIAGQKHR